MKNSIIFKRILFMVLVIGFQKLVAQPQFIIQDKVVFLVPTNNAQGQAAAQQSIIQDTVVFANGNGNVAPVKFDSIHNRLKNLKKKRSVKAGDFQWFNPHPTNSLNIEGYDIVIMSTVLPTKPLAEIRFARQKANVWIDKFKKEGASEIKQVTYSQQNRKADIETYGGFKFSLTIDAVSGKITFIKAANTEVIIYKTAKLF